MKFAIIGLIVFIGLILLFSGTIMSKVETPTYTVKLKKGDIEIREYPSLLIAEVQMPGERREAIQNGFRVLADYIFGNNQAQQKIAMTAPVTQNSSQKIAMTAPVMQSNENQEWKIQFTMPSEYHLGNLPKPKDRRVSIIERKPESFIVIRFSGTTTDENIKDHQEKLDQYIKNNNIKTNGAAIYAFYNPPWTLPFLRRNEIMFALK